MANKYRFEFDTFDLQDIFYTASEIANKPIARISATDITRLTEFVFGMYSELSNQEIHGKISDEFEVRNGKHS
jgi:hypothetical protein